MGRFAKFRFVIFVALLINFNPPLGTSCRSVLGQNIAFTVLFRRFLLISARMFGRLFYRIFRGFRMLFGSTVQKHKEPYPNPTHQEPLRASRRHGPAASRRRPAPGACRTAPAALGFSWVQLGASLAPLGYL